MKTIYWYNHTLWKAVLHAFFGLRIVGKEKLIEDGAVIIASNHVSFLDPPLVGIAYEEAVYFLARKSLFRSFGAWLFPRMNVVPIDQDRPDMTSLKTIIKLIRAKKRVVIFPEGARTPDGTLQSAEAGTGLIVAKTKAVVQPVRIFGAGEALPRGSAKLTFCSITLVIGDPIIFTPEELKVKDREGYQKISDRIMHEIAQLSLD